MVTRAKHFYNTHEKEINTVSNLFSVLSHPGRLKILWLLKRKKNLSVHEIQNCLSISQSSVSQHLSILKHNNLVKEERVGKEVHYSLVGSKIINKILANALHLITYQAAANSELLSAYTELISFL